MEKEMVEYIKAFKKFSKESLKKGKIEVIFLYDDNCEVCDMQFNHFKNYLDIKFDGTSKMKGRENSEMIASRILPVSKDEKIGKKLMEEADAWATAQGNPDLKIRFFPSFIDYVTHRIIGTGFIVERPLKDMLNLAKLRRRRRDFSEETTEKLPENIKKKLKGKQCTKVACGLDESFEMKKKKEKRKD